ncbi:haloacid dehalogenase-like hydrolase (HAD) superfamily [Micractinium conductrix]|uniref:Haloacid dehalogenase-like hydrolase (HAD) superfamily n=1 Tax=Micractinium conductrix TaxID=554055 RepID=A0A2P6VDV7_9CHLO|nr:haloacid dehalogenase-like hydrolase (HAD) superfamily [Micractinium conductrix]|eukprot:PSC72259.1 haloacid dehalogenase-like hydrolase (HAD) superfamily [Micractinium conductrix]
MGGGAAQASAQAPPVAQHPPGGQLPVLLLDVMDTVVYDPFFHDMPRFFGLSFKELLAAKHPTAWIQFEKAEISEEELLRIFFADGRPVDGAALRQHMADSYRYLDGMEPLLQRLAASGTQMHAFSNYPSWWEMIEKKLRLSRYLQWTFVSCLPPIQGLRKPSAESFATVVQHLGLPPDRLLFVDDRRANVDGALAAGIPALRFESAEVLEAQLRERGFPL